jgi:hypothetical protein
MKDCRWLKPALVAQIEFVEWTAENHLRHTRFTALRDDNRHRERCRTSTRKSLAGTTALRRTYRRADFARGFECQRGCLQGRQAQLSAEALSAEVRNA